MVTVRELARSQGFPDSFVFHSVNEDVVTVRSIVASHYVGLDNLDIRCTDKSETRFLGPLLLRLDVSCVRCN